ncbi:MAG: hypothetical protein Q3X96_02110, partial [Dorea sp.]|nr:hypothetical protein [Dorea sp.]
IITDKNRGFYVKIIKDQEGHGFHVSMRSVAFCVNDKPKLYQSGDDSHLYRDATEKQAGISGGSQSPS